MSDFLHIDIIGERNALRNLDKMPDTVRAILVEKVSRWLDEVKQAVEDNINAKMQTKSGKLGSSVQKELVLEANRVDGRVFIRDVPYAAAQEKGAAIPAHIIRPRQAKVLAFFAASGDKVFATRVFHPGAQLLPQHFMKDAYNQKAPEFTRGIKQAVVEGIRQQMRSGR